MDRIEQLNVYCHCRKVGRLAIVGSSGMGALTYEPDISFQTMPQNLNLEELIAVADHIGLNRAKARKIALQTRDCVREMLKL